MMKRFAVAHKMRRLVAQTETQNHLSRHNKNYIKYFCKYWLQGHMQQQNVLKCNNGRKFPVDLKFYGNVFSAAVVENMPIRNKFT